jgi:hypothetical protein
MIGTYFPSGQTDEWLRWLDLYCIQRAEGEGAWPRLPEKVFRGSQLVLVVAGFTRVQYSNVRWVVSERNSSTSILRCDVGDWTSDGFFVETRLDPHRCYWLIIEACSWPEVAVARQALAL